MNIASFEIKNLRYVTLLNQKKKFIKHLLLLLKIWMGIRKLTEYLNTTI